MPAASVGAEIRHLSRKPGYSQRRAVAASLNMARAGRLRREGPRPARGGGGGGGGGGRGRGGGGARGPRGGGGAGGGPPPATGPVRLARRSFMNNPG